MLFPFVLHFSRQQKTKSYFCISRGKVMINKSLFPFVFITNNFAFEVKGGIIAMENEEWEQCTCLGRLRGRFFVSRADFSCLK